MQHFSTALSLWLCFWCFLVHTVTCKQPNNTNFTVFNGNDQLPSPPETVFGTNATVVFQCNGNTIDSVTNKKFFEAFCQQNGTWSHTPRCEGKIRRTCDAEEMFFNPLWGHRSISIDSDLGSLQPYFVVVMVTGASPFFAFMQLNDKRWCWRFEKTSVLQKRLSFWPSEIALPSIPAPCSGVVFSSCLGVWFAELKVNGLPALYSSCDLDDSVV